RAADVLGADRPGDPRLPGARPGRAAHRPADRAGQAYADHVGRGDPAGADADLADRPAVGRRPGPARGASICTDERGWRSGGRALQMTAKNTSGRGQRELRVRVKTAKGRKLSSTLWLERQLNDPYVQAAK